MPAPAQMAQPTAETSPPIISNARLGLLIFLAAETMLFAGLIGGYLVLRYGTTTWPPPGQPYLPIGITWGNTAVLLGSAILMQLALQAVGNGKRSSALRRLVGTAALGVLFLAVQGSEWVRLLRHGLTVAHGVYGAIFMVLIGLHGVHVLAAVAWLSALVLYVRAQRFLAGSYQAVDLGRIYWFFVCALWLVLFKVVYLG
jgi:cytochrome c oxidase subunit 3